MSEYTLYSFWKSSCSARLRIALNLKGIPYKSVPVDLLKGEQTSDAHKKLNPSGSVPLLLGETGFKIGQSLAALEYLEESHVGTQLLPPTSDVQGRAIVRTLASIIACDTQPVTNLRILNRVSALGGNAETWAQDLMADGLQAYEVVTALWAGNYSYGDSVTIADACLLPAVWNAKKFKVDMSRYPTIVKVVERLEQLEAVQRSFYSRQVDTPEEFRSLE